MVIALRHDPGPLRVKLLGHRPDLVEEVGGPGDELVELREQEVATLGSGTGLILRCPAPASWHLHTVGRSRSA